MPCTVRIRLDLDARTMDAVQRSLEPDNVDFPPGLGVEIRAEGGAGLISVSGDISRVIGTVDEVLAHAQTALDVVER